MVGTIKIFCIRKNTFPQDKESLFLPCNMAAVQNLYRCLHINWNGSVSTYFAVFLVVQDGSFWQCLSASSVWMLTGKLSMKLKDLLMHLPCSRRVWLFQNHQNQYIFLPPTPPLIFSFLFHIPSPSKKKPIASLFAYFNAIVSFNNIYTNKITVCMLKDPVNWIN